MAHPMASQSASSVTRRMKVIGGKSASAGKSWGSTAMASKSGNSYPSKNAGSQVPYFAEGGSVGSRPDRMARGGKKGSKKKGHTTVVVNIPPSGGPPIGAAPGQPPGPPPPPIPIQVPRAAPPVAPGPMPVPGPGPMPVAGPPRPPMPVGPPGLPPGVRPPGMKRGGSVKKFADGGFLNPNQTDETLGQGGPGSFSGWMKPDIPAQTVGARPFKKGGKVHDDAAQDKKLISKMMKKEEASDDSEKMANGGKTKRAQLGMAVPPIPARRPMLGGGAGPVPAPVAASPVAKVAGLARRGAVANKAAVQRQAVRDVRDAGPRPLKDGGAARKANGGSIKQGGDGTKQYGEGRGYPVMKNGNNGLGRLEKIKKNPV